MKTIIQKLTAEPEEGFVFKDLRAAGFDCPWHAHSEFELILVLQANGYRVVGDNITPLTRGDTVLLGPGLPHVWHHEPSGRKRSGVHALLIQFDESFVPETWLRLEPFAPVRRLLKRAARGLHVVGRTRDAVAAHMMTISKLKGVDRVLKVLKILHLIAAGDECEPVASASFVIESQLFERERMNRVLQFLNSRLEQPIRVSDAARIFGLSQGAFGRNFRVHTGKTFPQFVNELRIGRACRLLIEDNRSITEVSYECGFQNLSNFNRQFLRLKRMSPREFRRQIQVKIGEFAA